MVSQHLDPCHYFFLGIIYFANAVSEWSYFEILLVCFYLLLLSAPFPTTVLVTTLQVCTYHCSHRLDYCDLEFDLTICNVCSKHIIIHLNPVFCSEFWWLIISVVQQIYDLFQPDHQLRLQLFGATCLKLSWEHLLLTFNEYWILNILTA